MFKIDVLEAKISMLENTITKIKNIIDNNQCIINDTKIQLNNHIRTCNESEYDTLWTAVEYTVFWAAIILLFKL
jgi:hypothetical protein